MPRLPIRSRLVVPLATLFPQVTSAALTTGAILRRARARSIAQWSIAQRYPAAVLVLILVAAAVRLGLVLAGWPGSDSDDATMGLMGIHILRDGEHPIFFYGQSYMGSIEAHVAALVFAALGVSVLSLKIALILLYCGFFGVMGLLLAQVFGRRLALVGLGLLIFAGHNLLGLQLHAYGGYLETILFGALVTLLGAWLVRTANQPGTSTAQIWAFGAWGLAAGLGIYSDPLVVPFVALSAAGLAIGCWRDLRGRLGALALAALLLGLSPWAVFSLTTPAPGASMSFLQHPAQRQVATPTAASGPSMGELIADRLLGTVVVAVPDMTGAEASCPVDERNWTSARWTTPESRACAVLRGAWGLAFLGLLGTTIALEARMLRAIRRTASATWTREQRERAAQAIACLVALGAPAVTIVAFTASDASAFAPWIFSRYLIGVLIALPFVVATLWRHTSAPPVVQVGVMLRPFARWVAAWSRCRAGHPRGSAARCDSPHRLPGDTPRGSCWWVLRVGQIAALLLTLALMALGTIGTYRDIPRQRQVNREQQDLVVWLLRAGDTRVYSEYWTCYRMMFQSGDRIICGVLGNDLTPRANRYPPYDAMMRAAVSAGRRPAFVFPLASAQAVAFPAWAAAQPWHYRSTTVDGQFVIFTVLP